MSLQASAWVWSAVRGIKSSPRLVLLALANYVDHRWRWTLSLKRVASDTGLTVETVRRSLRALSVAGFVRVETSPGRSSRYTLTPPENWGVERCVDRSEMVDRESP